MPKKHKTANVDLDLIVAIEDAIAKEQTAQVFYTKASGLATAHSVKALFRELKADEVEHERLLTGVLEDLLGGKGIKKLKGTALKPPDKEIVRLFGKEIPKTTTRYEEALAIAMRREKDARDDYVRLAKSSPTETLRDLFHLLAHVEAGHLKRLKKVYRTGP
jgi:rubrerythrin